METRQLRYFVAVAEELHFGRAARRLGIAQPPLSRAIGRLEDDLGTRLLERTSRATTLTPAGEVLLREARAALDAVDAAERRVRRVADGVVVAAKSGAAGPLLSALLEAYPSEPGAVPVDVLLCGLGEQAQALRDGRADVALLHRPYDETTGFDVVELATEGQVLLLPAGHPLARRPNVPLAEAEAIADLPRPRWPRADGTYPDGPGAEVRDHGQLYGLIALGRASWIAPVSCRHLLRDDVVTVPVLDAPKVTTVIAWPAHNRHVAVDGLVRTARRLVDVAPARAA